MTEAEIKQYIRNRFPKEDEACDWKEFSNLKHVVKGHASEDMVSYVSAFSNMEGGHLVMGIKDGTFEITGIIDTANYTPESLKAKLTENCINLPAEGLHVMELVSSDTHKRIWILCIPKHNCRRPVYAHNQAWQRVGDTLVPMRQERLSRILNEMDVPRDWSAEIIPEATMADLDPLAIKKAREEYIKRNPSKETDVMAWDDAVFLNKAKLNIQGKITRTSLILLGKEESEHFLSPYVAKIRWCLKTIDNQNKDYEIFNIPFILTVDAFLLKVRNVKYRMFRNDSLFPDEMLRYDLFNLREPLHNCIAHQDYSKCARIEIVEIEDDRLIFQNHGVFLPESVENVVKKDCPESVYRNKFLVEAMRNLNMIETEGGGIKKMFNKQRQRYFPMPDYDLSDEKVRVTIIGKVLDENFAHILSHNASLSLAHIMMLDKVQKHLPLTEEEYHILKRSGFIEGRKPNYFLSAKVVSPTKNQKLKANYIHNRAFDNEHYRNLILQYLDKFGSSTREDITTLLWDKLPMHFDDKKKTAKIGNLLSSLRIAGLIKFEKQVWIRCLLPK
ncbi:MAG: putative DNA binding domain-containing protein [Bacteroides sp.]|nr:putative DNA binding domain-containing protein [Bacteroides sp.]